MLLVAAAGGWGFHGQVFSPAAVGQPPAPFEIGIKGGGDNENGENAEKNLHGSFRIARAGAQSAIHYRLRRDRRGKAGSEALPGSGALPGSDAQARSGSKRRGRCAPPP
jgi:hypothetical protein